MPEQNRIRPATCGIALYFMLGVLDVLNIAAIGSALKIAALLPLLLMLFQLKDLRLRIHPLLLWQTAFWFLAVTSLFYSVSYIQTVTANITLTLNLMLVLVLGTMVPFNDRELKVMQKAMLLGCWLQIVMTFLFADFSAAGRMTLRFGESAQDHNNNNAFFLFAFSYYCYHFLNDRQGRHLAAALLILFMVLMSGSRGALLAYILTVFSLICVYVRNKKNAKKTILSVAVFILVVVLLFEWGLTKLPESVAIRFSWKYLQEKGSTGRTDTWMYLWNRFANADFWTMLFGHGYGSTIIVNEFNHNVAHNLYIDNLITLGFVGLFLQIASQATVLWIFYKRKKYEFFGAYIGMIGMCMSLSLTACKPLWNMMLIALAIDCNEFEALSDK